MLTTNALKLRQNLGSIIRQLKKTGKPILIEKNREPAAVLISVGDYQRRFVDLVADEKREALIAKIKAAEIPLPKNKTSLDLIALVRS